MRVLFITGLGHWICGEREYGSIWARELRKLGVEIREWDGYGGHTLPGERELRAIDLIHVNWGPSNLPHYQPEHFPPEIPLSVFMHDVEPHSHCPLASRAELLMSYEPSAGSIVLDHAVPTYDGPFPEPPKQITVGLTGIRGDRGREMVIDECEKRGWKVSTPGWWGSVWSRADWISTEQEIMRLASCTLNVCWYHTSTRGKSMAAMFCVAARRPLLLSGSTMFSALWPYDDEITIVREAEGDAPLYYSALAGRLESALTWQRRPNAAVHELSWARLAQRIKKLWEGVAR